MSENETAIRLPDPKDLIVSCSPHIHDASQAGSIQKIMICVILALLPACATGVYFFGLNALYMLLTCVFSCVFFEWIWGVVSKKRTTIGDYSAVVSGLILGMNLSAGLPLTLGVLGALVTIFIGKMLYGGLGYNPFNPAVVGRVFLLLSFPGYMTSWVATSPLLSTSQAVAVTCATPLRTVSENVPYWDYFVGNMPGCLGETSALALLVGGLFLIALKIIKWQVPLAFLGTLAIMTLLVGWLAPESAKTLLDVPFQLLTGGAVLAAFFMCTDMVTTPVTTRGAVIFAIGAGIITASIRFWGGYPEGASFSILLMNALTPLIDRFAVLKPFGTRKCAGGAR